MGERFDVVVVGASVAGCATAVLLARAGIRTLLVEGHALPAHQVLSTHFIHPPGMDVLDELGVGQRIRALAPPSRRAHGYVEGARVVSHYTDGRAGYCVRRSTLDPLLQDLALAAGVEVRDRHRVVELLRDGERVSGVALQAPTGRTTIAAGLVVGADGTHSTVAKLVGAEAYLDFELTRAAYWGYHPTPDAWRDGDRYGCDAILAWEGDALRYVFQCDGDLLLVVGTGPLPHLRAWGPAHAQRLEQYLAASPVTGPLVDANPPVGKTVGVMKYRAFYRRAVGPGYALVGDAGLTMDFVTGQGITQALLSAKALASTIQDDTEHSYARYWRQRDADTLPWYLDAKRLGDVGFNTPFMRLLFTRLAERAEPIPLLEIMDRRRSPFDLVDTPTMLRFVLGDLLRGRTRALPSFLATGRAMADHRRLCRQYSERARAHADAPSLAPWPLNEMGSVPAQLAHSASQ